MNSSEPLVSVCIPVFNRADLLWRAIESALNQTYRNLEVVVGDNASADGTAEVVKKYAARDNRVKYFRNDTNIGSGNNFLKCAEHASGLYMQALGSDDWLSRGYIEECVRAFEAHPEAAAVLSNVITLEHRKGENKFEFLDEAPIETGEYPADWFFRHVYLGGAGGMGFISFMRKDDSLLALRKVLGNQVNMFWRGDRYEPFDMPIFLEVLAKYVGFFVTKEPAYIKTVHGKDHVGLEGDSFGSREGMVRYTLALRRAFESFYSEHGLRKHFKKLRFFGGLSVAVNSLLARFGSWPEKGMKEKYFSAVSEYFDDYSTGERCFIIISIVPYAVFRIVARFAGLFARRRPFVPDPTFFLTGDSEFRSS